MAWRRYWRLGHRDSRGTQFSTQITPTTRWLTPKRSLTGGVVPAGPRVKPLRVDTHISLLVENMWKWLFQRTEKPQLVSRKAFQELCDQMEQLARSQKGIRLDWEEAFERVERLLKRLNGVLAASKKHDQPEEQEEPGRKSVAPPEAFQRYGTREELETHRKRRFGGLLR